ncbi:hypothetical protein DUNSADRAFT_12070 [Dunaliella salina]|uniref:Dynamin N-terminal domain-containing protein n=1 Tax=Dunaliella salina TaxID=3046 RepID=A0ABQ7H431_DUNSA|nr:hypothetical protein DUNSADRAFT_12070 [Dunaliella salina]|eukprot:KAF5841614.1 hypothetical protein DUNSADRAFT_12070 [Dunaliella salina]
MGEEEMRQRMGLTSFGKRRRLALAIHGPKAKSQRSDTNECRTPATAPPASNTASHAQGADAAAADGPSALDPLPIAPFSAPTVVKSQPRSSLDAAASPTLKQQQEQQLATPLQQHLATPDQQQQQQAQGQAQGQNQGQITPMDIDGPTEDDCGKSVPGGVAQGDQPMVDVQEQQQQQQHGPQQAGPSGGEGNSGQHGEGREARHAAKRPPRQLSEEQLMERQLMAEGSCVGKCQWAAKKLLKELTRHRGWAAGSVEQARLEELMKLQEKQQMPGMSVVVVGNTGAGKSTLLNALIGERNALPTNGMRACTAVLAELSYADDVDGYYGEVEFLTHAEWEKELDDLLELLTQQDGRAVLNVDQDAHNYGAWAKLYAIYGERYTYSRECTGRSADGRLQYK